MLHVHELVERALAAIKGRLTRQRRRQAERQARKDASRQIIPMHPWGPRAEHRRARKSDRGNRHTRSGRLVTWNATKSPPWQVRERNRRRNKAARLSRRRNRVTR